MQERYLVGTYTRSNESEGLYYLVPNSKTGLHKIVSTTKGMVENPIYLAMTEDKEVFYAITKDAKGGGIITGSLDEDVFTLYEADLLDDMGPCDIKLAKTENYVFTGHYGAGKLVTHAVDGSIIERVVQIVDHKLLEEPGQTARVHFVQEMADGYLLVCDLGLDSIFSYPYDPATGLVDVDNVKRFHTAVGAGPRNLVVSKDEKYVFCINELSTTLDVYTYEDGTLTRLDTYATVDELVENENPALASSGAAIKLSNDGHRLYASIRGSNVIVTYNVLPHGVIERLEITATEGEHPRDFELSLDNKKMFVANQLSDNVTVFTVDEQGIPVYTGESIEIPSAVHVKAF